MAIALLQEWENMGLLMQLYAMAYDINKAHSLAYAVLMHQSTVVLTRNGTIASSERAAQTADIPWTRPVTIISISIYITETMLRTRIVAHRPEPELDKPSTGRDYCTVIPDWVVGILLPRAVRQT